MANKLSDYQNLMNQLQQFKEMSGNMPRQTALDDQGLGYIGRPIEEMEPAPTEEPVLSEQEQQTNDAIANIDWNQVSQQSPILGQDTDAMSIQEAQELVSADRGQPVAAPSDEPIAPQNLPPVQAPQEDRVASLMQEYKKAQEQYSKDISEAAEKDRKAALIQALGESLGKAITYSGFAGGNVMSGPIPLEFREYKPNYLQEAKLKGDAKIESYRELLNNLRTNRALGNKTEIVNLGGEVKMVTYDADGNIIKDQSLGQKTLTEAQKAQQEIEKLKEAGKNARQAENIALRENALELGKDKFNWQKIEKNELSEKQVDRISGMNTTLDSLDKLEGMKTFSTGPLTGRIEAAKRFLGEGDAKKTAMAAQLRMILSQYGKSISGAAIAEPEMKRLEMQLPQETDSNEQFAAKLANFKDEIENSRVRVLDDISKSGRDVKSFVKRDSIDELKQKYSGQGKQIVRKQYSPSRNQTKVIYSDGSEEIVEGRK